MNFTCGTWNSHDFLCLFSSPSRGFEPNQSQKNKNLKISKNTNLSSLKHILPGFFIQSLQPLHLFLQGRVFRILVLSLDPYHAILLTWLASKKVIPEPSEKRDSRKSGRPGQHYICCSKILVPCCPSSINFKVKSYLLKCPALRTVMRYRERWTARNLLMNTTLPVSFS